MKFPEECVKSCMQVCRGFSDAERPVWILPLLICAAASIGFVVGRYNLSSLLEDLQRVLRSSREPRAVLSQLYELFSATGLRRHQAKCNKHNCLLRTSSLEKTAVLIEQGKQTKIVASKQRCTRVKETMATDPSNRNKNEDSPQISPQSVSSNSSTSSSKKETLSPLLLGSKRTTPQSSAETSPGRKKRSPDADSLTIEDITALGDSSSSSKPSPLAIPSCNTTVSESGTPTQSPEVISPSLSVQEHAVLTGDGTIPAAAWMCGNDVASMSDAASMDLECSFRWLDLIAVNLEAVFGEEWMKSVHPDDILHCKEVIELAGSVRGPFQMEYRLQVGQNHYRWVLDIGKPRSSSLVEDFAGFVGWRIDIHERKTIENNYWKYWTLPHEFLVTWSGDGHFFDKVSLAFPSFLGYTSEEFKSVEWMNWVHDEDKISTKQAFDCLKEGKPVVNLINRFRCQSDKVDGPSYTDATGTYKWLNWTASDMFAACRDITADQLARMELQRSQQELQRITDVIPGGVFLYRVTKEGNECFPYMSKGALNLLNVDPDVNKVSSRHGIRHSNRVFGLNVFPDDWPRLEGEMRQAISLQVPLDHDYRVIRSTGIRWVRVHAVPRIDSCDLVEWSGIAWDITEQHQLVDGLKKARDVAEKAALANRNFLAHMSHEIRTPMNAVIGMGALLLETDLTDEQREFASTIRSSGEALLGIINDILDYSKIEAGKMELEMQPVDVLQCVEESFDLVVPQAALKSLELTYSVSDSVPAVVLGDANRIRQILVNLLSNSVKFTEEGSISVVVDGHRLEDSILSDKGCGKTSYRNAIWEIEFTVTDSGIGIPDDRKDSLFQVIL